ncbi:MAG: polyisoprenoid-binding protein [Alphaproteobacteria bacterium]|nr:polyisoprenoid-binding protein [Alphaproteobacteria bacterium]
MFTASTFADSPPPVAPLVLPHGQKDISLVPSGSYTLDPNHAGVVARVSHLGFSLSVFRFDRVSAVLDWDHDNPARSKLRASVETGSIATNVVGFASQLSGQGYLNSAKWPEATFVSRHFVQIDATHGHVDGDFTLMGKTKPVSFAVTLIGAGPGFAGGPVIGHVIGVEASTQINPQDYGLPPIFSEPIEIIIDTEFDKKPR